MKIKEALIWSEKRLKKITFAPYEAEVILSYLLNKPRHFLFTYPNKELSKEEERKFKNLINKRNKHYPLAYLIQSQEFFGEKIYLDKNVFIPRPETEILAEKIIKEIKKVKKENLRKLTFLDVGTGSGCLFVSILKNIPQIKAIALDISPSALRIAKKNAQKHNLESRVSFFKGNLLLPLKNAKLSPLVFLGANLPYLTPNQYKKTSLEIKKYEPKSALLGGEDGLFYYKELLKQIKELKIEKSIKKIFLEIDPLQKRKIKEIIKKNFPLAKTEIIKDYHQRERVVKITLDNSLLKS